MPVSSIHRKTVDRFVNLRAQKDHLIYGVGFLKAIKKDYKDDLLGHGPDGTATSASGTVAQVRADEFTLPCGKQDVRSKRFEVALSFPGERRAYVRAVAGGLAGHFGREHVLFDEYHTSEFARPNLDVHLQHLYHDQSELVVLFVCAEYNEKDWCGLECRAIRDLIKRRERRDEEVMPMRFDSAGVPGFFSIDGYIDVAEVAPEKAVDLIRQRVATIKSCGLTSDPRILALMLAVRKTRHSFEQLRENQGFTYSDSNFEDLIGAHRGLFRRAPVDRQGAILPGISLTKEAKEKLRQRYG